MIIDCIADLHGHYPKLEGGDLLIIAGDLVADGDSEDDYHEFHDWCLSLAYNEIIVIAGNHDNLLQKNPYLLWWEIGSCVYLCDSGTELCLYPELRHMEEGKVYERQDLKIWGSPWTKTFKGMNPKCKAFTVDTEEELAEKWKMIPDDVDILITHSPPLYGLDKTYQGEHVGSLFLTKFIFSNKIKLCIFGHIHENYGIIDPGCMEQELQDIFEPTFKSMGKELSKTILINASHVNEHYEPVNKPIRVIL